MTEIDWLYPSNRFPQFQRNQTPRPESVFTIGQNDNRYRRQNNHNPCKLPKAQAFVQKPDTHTNGSIHPNTAVVVEPTCCTDKINVKSETNVGIKANNNKYTPVSQSGIGSKGTPFTDKFKPNTMAPAKST